MLFAGTRGFIDKYDVEKVRVYEEQLLSFVESKYPDIMKEIEDKKDYISGTGKEDEGSNDGI